MVISAAATAEHVTDDYEIIVVDDGSRDASPDVLKHLQRLCGDHLRIVWHEANRGYGGALRSGFESATKEWIFYTDGDAQYDPRELRKLAELADNGTDVVQGYKVRRHDPWYRIVIGKLYQHAMRFLFRLRIRDVDCDFRLIRRSVFREVCLTQNSGIICLEMILKMHRAHCRFREIGVSHFYRQYGKSQFFNWRRILRVGRGVIRLWFDDLAYRRKHT
jgi:glycosyltransferase involved in cell wall biosynthesis